MGDMDPAYFTGHNGREICLVDLSGIKESGMLQRMLGLAGQSIAERPRESVRLLIDVSGVCYDSSVADAMRRFVADVASRLLASATVGDAALKCIALRSLLRLSSHRSLTFADCDQAKDWLAMT